MVRPVALLMALASVSATVSTQSQPAAFDMILRGGTILDGSGSRPYIADVGVRNGRIAAIGDLSARRAETDLDVRRLYVAPGFINIHSHPIQDGLTRAYNMLTQGVTTEIVNPDGGGPLNVAEQLGRVASAGLAVNVGAYIGFNSAWSMVVGTSNRRPVPDEIEQMRGLLLRGLQDGAWGVSSGLDYKPAYFAQAEDVVRVVSAAAPWRTNFTNHDRITPESNFSSRAGVAETVTIASRAGLLPVVTHMKAQGLEQGDAPAILRMMKQGRYTAADAYPYLAGQSGLGALIVPGWAQEGGREAMVKRFAEPSQRAKIVAEAEQAMQARFGGPQGVYVTTIGRELTDVMREMNVSGGEAIVRLLESREMGAILRFGAEADLVAILKNPGTSVACDCGATPAQATHPRYYGSFPRVLGRYVRDTKALTWEDAIRKMTALPAATIGMTDRGLLAVGMAADVTVFDPVTVIDRATFEQPTLPSEGIRHVLVNGRLALRDGDATGERAGRALKRSANMPSRPMSRGKRRVTAAASVGSAQVTVDVRQDPSARSARGSFRVKDGAGSFEAFEFGVLQATAGWASFTARARFSPSGEERAVTVVLDQADPAAPGTPRLVVEADGQMLLSGSMQGRFNVTSRP
jgi:N-acyl-D-aspartate/D-glutamate deacylase